ncbi:MAG: hypothetical protein M1814_003309 [Vezdaea aestivalis]|nr:MAG: hypothetical protein M1814_003309 [Vezdaea aestivalis]
MEQPITTFSSSAGSQAFAALALLTISLIVLVLLRHFLPLRTTPAYLVIPIFFALFLPASTIILVPIDLASSSGTDSKGSRGIWLTQGVMLVAWRIAYWLTFALTWFILPLLGEFMDSGYRSPQEKMMYSLRSNLRYQLIYLGSGAAGMIYFFYSSGASLHTFKALIMALAYMWGLALAIYLMGYGLVAIPRELFRNADIGGRLRRLQTQAPKIHDRMEDAIQKLDKLEGQVKQLQQRKHIIPRDLQEWVEELNDVAGSHDMRLPPSAGTLPATAPTVPTVITEQFMADLTRKFYRARHARARFIDEWGSLVNEAAFLQAVLDSAASKRLDLGVPSPHSSIWGRVTLLTPYTRYLFYSSIVPAFRYASGGILSIASVFIIWSELTKKISPKLSLITLTIVHHPSSSRGQIGFSGQLIAAAWLFYMCTAALTSISAARIWGNRALVRRNTYAESACWYSTQVARLTVPLAYNFINFLPPQIYSQTTFQTFLGGLIKLTPLGESFNYFFPISILIPIVFTLFGLYGKLKAWFGFTLLDDFDDEGNEDGLPTNWREGADLIERELAGGGAAGLVTAPPSGNGGSRIGGAPTLWVPPAQRDGGVDGPAPGRVAERTATRRAQQVRMEQQAEEEEENFFEGFAHRVRNTFEGVDRPKWMAEGLKTPKWMQRGEEPGGDGLSEGIGRWFGGGPREGGVRL